MAASQPNLADYLTFIANVMQIPSVALPNNSPWVAWSLSQAMMVADPNLALIATPVSAPVQINAYTDAVYNLAGDLLVNYAPDQTGQTYFATAREGFRINAVPNGIVTSTSDESTSTSISIPPASSNFTLGQLQNLKTPWGRVYLAYAQASGSLWGIS